MPVDRLFAAAPVLWALMAIAFAANRSLWADEWNHVQDLFNYGVLGAALELLKKPSPFHPGEALLNGFFWKTLGAVGVPAEVWARAQGILWGALTVALGSRLAKREPQRLAVLPALLFFSTAMLSYATEMRPYASLLYSGALCAAVLWEGKLEGALPRIGAWPLILFGHLYGICFLAGCLLWVGRGRRYWPEILASVIVVAGTLASIHIVTDQGIAPWDGVIQISRQVLGTWANPHKAILVYGPLAAWGFWQGWRTQALRSKTVVLTLFITGAAALPVAATVYGKYFFVPRQTAAGTAPFLLLCALGAHTLKQRKAVLGVLLLCAICTWSAVSLFKLPPFPSQPFHRFKDVAENIAHSEVTDVLFLDVCNWGPFDDYLSRHFPPGRAGAAPHLDGGLAFEQKCWNRSAAAVLCVTVLTDSIYCTLPASMLTVDQPLGRAVHSRQFQKVIHGYQDDPAQFVPEFTGRFQRDW
jgi:hypothetical protein